MTEILEDVAEGVRDLAAGREDVSVVPINKDLPPTSGGPVDRARHADGEALHAAGEAFGAFSFDKQVEVISLDGEVNDPNPEPVLSFADRGANCLKQLPSTQVSYASEHSQRHVHRMARWEAFPLEMRDARLVAFRFAPCAAPFAAPGW